MPASEPFLLHLAADFRTQLRNICRVAGQFFRFVAIGQSKLYPLGFKVLLTTLGKSMSKPTDKLLTATMFLDVF
jgi:hypothetical protein